jgi:site-specific recombinase XerD
MWNLDEFLHDLESGGLSERTVGNYRLHVSRFIQYCQDRGITDCKALTDTDVGDYIHSYIERRPDTPGWKYSGLLSLKRYFQFLTDSGALFAPPAMGFKKPRDSTGSYKPVDQETLRFLLDSFPTDRDADITVKAILELGYSSALRPAEIRKLKIEDIDVCAGILFIEQAKGQKDRRVPVGKMALEWLQIYIKQIRLKYVEDPAERTIFLGPRTRRPFSHRGFTEFVRYRLKKHRLPHIAPHQLRSSAATHMVSGGVSIGYVQHLLGHSNLNTTKIYVSIQADELSKIMRSKHPRNFIETKIRGGKNHDI